ncbi:MAG: hypothetical protein ONB06_01745 [candidate division KSB1 bacterium]|nr:hypothetical protein [candidate division KSB1 bacterium]
MKVWVAVAVGDGVGVSATGVAVGLEVAVGTTCVAVAVGGGNVAVAVASIGRVKDGVAVAVTPGTPVVRVGENCAVVGDTVAVGVTPNWATSLSLPHAAISKAKARAEKLPAMFEPFVGRLTIILCLLLYGFRNHQDA